MKGMSVEKYFEMVLRLVQLSSTHHLRFSRSLLYKKSLIYSNKFHLFVCMKKVTPSYKSSLFITYET